ncbi:EutN/CcmL family microcompartment protein [Anaerobium acetethylicum]|uniref:Ethanolamine utilization protein EutN n=1 Tax=Anaerobium acetethylicum TaxID=1619234 RepID=A0A1D3TS55_9FIRM|nr:EutN/CcmL family microcompartment protein [Anaerobium acetethylicum]SCP96660.1 ethanolamine utilization protein EutN [Anaerobium acetethylicum]
MIIGKVVGTVICTRKNENLVGSKFLLVDPMQKMGSITDSRIVAVDNVGAGIGDIVLLATGSAARVGCGYDNSPIDACVVGIVDDPQKIVIVE